MNKEIHVKLHKVSNKKMICSSDRCVLFCSGSKVFCQGKETKQDIYIGRIPIAKKYKWIQDIRIAQRLFRLEPRCGMFIDTYTALFSMHGAVYRISILDKTIIKEHVFRNGMNNPLTFCKVENLDGFVNGIYYGEYFGNGNREEVHIYRRDMSGSWEMAYTFEAGIIQHIHRIFVHKKRKSIFVLTGDMDEESAIWECRDNFAEVKKLVGGKQIYRACVAFPYENGIVYATDTPLEQNSIYQLIDEEGSICLIKWQDIDGPCIYGAQPADEEMFFSTSVEPDSRIKPKWRYRLSYKLGPGVKNRYSHIYVADKWGNITEIVQGKKDILPMLLFGFGTFLFADSFDGIYCTGQGLKKFDGKTLKVEIE